MPYLDDATMASIEQDLAAAHQSLAGGGFSYSMPPAPPPPAPRPTTPAQAGAAGQALGCVMRGDSVGALRAIARLHDASGDHVAAAMLRGLLAALGDDDGDEDEP